MRKKICFPHFRVTPLIFWGLPPKERGSIKTWHFGIGVLQQFGTTWHVAKIVFKNHCTLICITVQTRVGHSVLLRSERYDLSRSKKRTLRSFTFFSRVFGDLWDPKERYVLFRSFEKNGKERKERNVLLQRTEKNAKNVTFFCKERERTWERFVLLQMNLERNVLCYVLFSRYI